VTWDGGGDGSSWEDAANWSGDSVPTSFDDVVIAPSTTVSIASSTTIYSLTLGNAAGTTSPTLNFDYDAIGGDPLTISGGDLTLYSGATLTHTAGTSVVGGTISIDVTSGNAVIDSGSTINLEGKGYQAYAGSGKGSNVSYTYGAGGAGYGGEGGGGNGGASGGSAYGSTTAPIDVGSGGGTAQRAGGHGGGALKLVVSGTTTIDGSVSAAGGTGSSGTYGGGGGGSGGSVYIVTSGITGTGTVSVDGGTGGNQSSGNDAGGGGGGGRVALYYTNGTTSGLTLTAIGGGGNGVSAQDGAAGTVYIKGSNNTNGDLFVDNTGRSHDTYTTTYNYPTTPMSSSTAFDTLSVTNNAVFEIANGTTTVDKFTFASTTTVIETGDFSGLSTANLLIPSGAIYVLNRTRTFDSIDVAGSLVLASSASSSVFGSTTITGNALSEADNLTFATTSISGGFDFTGSAGGHSFGTTTVSGTLYISTGTDNVIFSGPTDVSGTLTLGGDNEQFDKNVTVSGTLDLDGTNQFNRNLTVSGNLTHDTNTTSQTNWIDIAVLGDFTLESGGTVGVDAKGYQYRAGPGKGTNGGSYYGGGGAGYGGEGGVGGNGASGGSGYGSTTAPTSLGSGGGNGNHNGGVGGGAVKIIVSGTTTIAGTISADGGVGTGGSYGAGGGGSGGSVYIVTNGITGTGAISVDGGSGGKQSSGDDAGGGGGGGRLALYYTNGTTSGLTLSSIGGSGKGASAKYGAAGTIYIKGPSNTHGDLLLANNGQQTSAVTSATTTLALHNLTVESPVTFDLSSSPGISISGDYTNSGTVTWNSAGTTTFNGTGQQTASGTLNGTSAFGNVAVANTGTTTFSANASTTNLTLSAGTLIAPSHLSVSGDYTNNAVFDANGGTVTLNGAAQQTAMGTMTGSSAFDNLAITNTSQNGTTSQSIIFGASASTTGTLTMQASTSAQFLAGATSTFTNINLAGTSGSPVWLRSSSQGTQWYIVTTGTQSASHVHVEDSNACGGDTITTVGSDDDGNNSCWTFNNPSTISSAADQMFSLGQATTTISTITITAGAGSGAITIADDIRISIATGTVDMHFDTNDTTATYGGTASGKVNTAVSYEGGGSVLVIPVTSDFTGGDTLTISGLSFAQFNATNSAATALSLDTNNDGSADATDDKTVTITGSLTLANADVGQVSDNFEFFNDHDVELYRFKLTPAGEDFTIPSVTFGLSAVRGLSNSNFTNLGLYRDLNGDGTVDAGEPAVGGSGAVSISNKIGTITFSSSWSATTSQDFILKTDVNDINHGDSIFITLSSVSGTGTFTNAYITSEGSAGSVQHVRSGGGGGAIGGSAPAGAGVRTGGSHDAGEEIGSTPGFNPPTGTGNPYNEWTNGANAYSSDSQYATSNTAGQRQSYDTFGFSVPGSNQIDGVEIKLEASASTASGTIEVGLSWDGGSSITTVKATPILSDADTVYTLGGAGDTWGRTWSPNDFTDTNFRVRLVSQPGGNTVKVDAIQVHVNDIATGGGSGGGGEI
jgi:hypothetical protein